MTLPKSIDLDLPVDAAQTQTQKFLHFNLSKELAALVLVENIAEVLHIPKSEILPIPQLPPCVLGIYNWRGEMLWTIALNKLLKLSPVSHPEPSSASTMSVIVAVIDGQYLGLVVTQVNEIEWHDLDLIQPPRGQLFPANLLPFMQGYLSESGTILIDPKAIARSPLIRQFNT